MEEETEQPKRKYLNARVSAKVIYALSPLMRRAFEFAHSELAFFNQINTSYLGTYLIPAEPGLIVAVTDGHRLVALRDPKGFASETMKVNFPDAMLERIVPPDLHLVNENGQAFPVESELKAEVVHCTDIFGMVCPSKEASEKYDGVLGSWMNGDYGNVIDSASYRCEPARVDFISNAISASRKPDTSSASTVNLNLALFEELAIVARRLDILVEVKLQTDGAVVIRSVPGDELFALVAPCKHEERTADRSIEADLCKTEAVE